MPDITDPAAVRFSNEKVRVAADKFAQAYYFAIEAINEWNATGMSSKITNTADPIIDGSAIDGRNPITGSDATNVITRLMENITDYEAASNAKLNTVIKVAVHTGQ